MLQLSPLLFWVSHRRTQSSVPLTHCFFSCLCPSRAPSSSSPRATSTWPSTTSRCCTMASWPAPSPSPTTPRPRTPSCAWSPRRGRTPPSSSTRHTPSCYRWVGLCSSQWPLVTTPLPDPPSHRPPPTSRQFTHERSSDYPASSSQADVHARESSRETLAAVESKPSLGVGGGALLL